MRKILTNKLKSGIGALRYKFNSQLAGNDFCNAAQSGDMKLLKKALPYVADIDAKNEYGFTALMLAASHDHANCVRAIIDAGASVNTRDSYGVTALISAVLNGNIISAKLLITAGADVNNAQTNGRTAIIEASRINNADIVKLLIASGCDIDAKDCWRKTALMQLAIRSSANSETYDCMVALVEAGADISHFKSNNTSLHSHLYSTLKAIAERGAIRREVSAHLRDRAGTGLGL